jgi:hypothetical protein
VGCFPFSTGFQEPVVVDAALLLSCLFDGHQTLFSSLNLSSFLLLFLGFGLSSLGLNLLSIMSHLGLGNQNLFFRFLSNHGGLGLCDLGLLFEFGSSNHMSFFRLLSR